MISERLKLALGLLHPSDWHRFEKLASAFLSVEFRDLRTVAAQSGDRGRDSELFVPAGDQRVVLQYSVAADWRRKIVDTATRLKVTLPDVVALVYVSNQEIGAAADDIKRMMRQDYGLSLDVRDQSWFVDRATASLANEKAAEELGVAVVDPYLSSTNVLPHTLAELSSSEEIAAVTYLALQWQDDTREKGLTKIAFGALVRAVLANTDSEHRMPREAVNEGVRALLPGHPVAQVDVYVDSALQRLTKKAIRHWQQLDEFCLTYEERQRASDFKTNAALGEAELMTRVAEISRVLSATFCVPEAQQANLAGCIRSAIDAILFERSQAFAAAVQSGSLTSLARDDFSATLLEQVSMASLPKVQGVDWVSVLGAGVREVLLGEEAAAQVHLRSLADAYTLLAFLRETPDVQGAVEKMFSYGDIWLDASVILPLLAEPLFDDSIGRFTRMVDAAREAGLSLFVTPGAIEEVERHMNQALICARMERGCWIGRVPYLVESYVASGRSVDSFADWLENFRGSARPEQDIGDYLLEEFGISTRSLEAESASAPAELREALENLWYASHRHRRERGGAPLDQMTITRLVQHDVECYCGVIQLRRGEASSPFGYKAWWLTIDRRAFDLKPKLQELMSSAPPDSPVMSADFMVNYLAFGPVRRRVGKAREARLPLIMELTATRHLTPELLDEAKRIREEIGDLPDRLIRRRVRDYLDQARMRLGPVANAGVTRLEDKLLT
jgi:hypothetical protein